jgi:putative iron-regulated protein
LHGGNCDRRAAYLKAVTDLLVDDLGFMAAQWIEGGAARAALGNGEDGAGLVAAFTGMGSLSYGELAGERMKLGLIVHDPEEEHDCFSDNTHHSHFYDALGIRNVYVGSYTRIDGTVVSGPSLSDLVKAKDATVDQRLTKALDATMEKMTALVERAKTV